MLFLHLLAVILDFCFVQNTTFFCSSTKVARCCFQEVLLHLSRCISCNSSCNHHNDDYVMVLNQFLPVLHVSFEASLLIARNRSFLDLFLDLPAVFFGRFFLAKIHIEDPPNIRPPHWDSQHGPKIVDQGSCFGGGGASYECFQKALKHTLQQTKKHTLASDCTKKIVLSEGHHPCPPSRRGGFWVIWVLFRSAPSILPFVQ